MSVPKKRLFLLGGRSCSWIVNEERGCNCLRTGGVKHWMIGGGALLGSCSREEGANGWAVISRDVKCGRFDRMEAVSVGVVDEPLKRIDLRFCIDARNNKLSCLPKIVI